MGAAEMSKIAPGGCGGDMEGVETGIGGEMVVTVLVVDKAACLPIKIAAPLDERCEGAGAENRPPAPVTFRFMSD